MWILFLILLVFVFFALIVNKNKRTELRHEELDVSCKFEISIEEAQFKVEEVINRGILLHATLSNGKLVLPDSLGPLTASFFQKYEKVSDQMGGFELNARDICVSECDPNKK